MPVLTKPEFSIFNNTSCNCVFDIHECIRIDDKIIAGGIVSKGKFFVGQSYFLGPDKLGNYKYLKIKENSQNRIYTL